MQNFVRPLLATVPGAAVPLLLWRPRSPSSDRTSTRKRCRPRVYRRKTSRTRSPRKTRSFPPGSIKIGSLIYTVKLNDAAQTIEEINDLPIKTMNGATIFVHDVGHVRDGSPPQQSIVHVDGVRAVLTTILKAGQASTLAIVQGAKDVVTKAKETLPPDFKLIALNDQSLFVKAAVSGVVKEGIIAAALTSLMILLFLGAGARPSLSRPSIPLAILCALVGLAATGETLNIMTSAAWPSLSASSSTTRPSPSRTSTGTSSRAKR